MFCGTAAATASDRARDAASVGVRTAMFAEALLVPEGAPQGGTTPARGTLRLERTTRSDLAAMEAGGGNCERGCGCGCWHH